MEKDSIKKNPDDFRQWYEMIIGELGKVIKGQDEAERFIVLALLNGGHVLVEGFPGLAKTLMAKALSLIIGVSFKRIQFTPDLMPADIVGTTVYDNVKNDFYVRKGPVFTNFLLADEINRAPAKTQSALLEAMQEKQVTIEGNFYRLEEPFITIATQNPIEYEGTYPLPEAQIDRFMFKVLVRYPALEDERKMLVMFSEGFDSDDLTKSDIRKVCDKEEFRSYRESLSVVRIDDKIMNYILSIVDTSRKTPGISVGASPRASISLMKSSRAYAVINGRDFIVPDDVAACAFPVLRHRLILETEAEIEGRQPDDFISLILSRVTVPR
jgi:MoxR-like ATPase